MNKEEIQALIDMPLHATQMLTDGRTEVLRVPGGWVYKFSDDRSHHYGRDNDIFHSDMTIVATQFVFEIGETDERI